MTGPRCDIIKVSFATLYLRCGGVVETLDPFASCPLTADAYTSSICSNSKTFIDSYAAYVCHLTHKSKVFETNKGHSLALRSAWSFVGFHNELSFQTVLSNSELNGQILRSGKLLTEDTRESLQLHNKAIQMMHQRLEDPEQHASDSMIGSMSGFLTYDISFCIFLKVSSVQ